MTHYRIMTHRKVGCKKSEVLYNENNAKEYEVERFSENNSMFIIDFHNGQFFNFKHNKNIIKLCFPFVLITLNVILGICTRIGITKMLNQYIL